MRFDCGSISLDLPPDWLDTTEEQYPFTLTKPHGAGALQFTVAAYSGGEAPSVSLAALVAMLNDFSRTHSLGPLSNQVHEQSELSLAAASFQMPDGTLGRVWYVSDGWSIAKITYLCQRGLFEPELTEAEHIVRSLRFVASGA
jgi:hypothetical protein